VSVIANRRGALRRATLATAAVGIGVLAPPLLHPGRARAQSTDDEGLRDFLGPAIALEQVAALAYDLAAKAKSTTSEETRTLELFRDQEQAHANALRSALDSLGFDLPDAPESATDTEVLEDVEGLDDERADELRRLLQELDGLESSEELLGYLTRLENEQIAYYLEAAPAVESEDLAKTSAEIVGNQAQHLVVLRLALGDTAADAVAAVAQASGDEGA
jgi:rubrerythrin